jgi:hypothetical protein
MSEHMDIKTILKKFYTAPRNPVIIDVPAFNFLMVNGKGDPNTSIAYQQALETLYGLSYTIKFSLKNAGRPDFKVMPLEGLWWIEGGKDFTVARKDQFSWISMMMQPEQVTKQDFEEAAMQLKSRKNPPALPLVRFESFKEGLACQILHIGSYSEEEPTINRLHAFVKEQGYKLRGKHHEIYIGNPARSAPEKLKTIIRQPVK